MRRLIRAVPALLLLFCTVSLFWPRGAETVPLFAAREGLMCGTCHFDPNGGGPRNEFGFNYGKNRHSLAPDDAEAPWGEMDLRNRVADQVPIYFGVNHRFMALTNTTVESDSLDRFGFFNMQTALHTAFVPHEKLALVYTQDHFNSSAIPKEAYGMIRGIPGNGYLKAGRIRNPFGLRMDDHTVGTRNGFLDFSSGQRLLPFDPRRSDMGLEYGWDDGAWFGRAAFTNGGSTAENIVFQFQGRWAEAKTVKVGYNHPSYQGAVSFYDNFLKGSSSIRRQTRWGYYGMTHYGPVTLLGEIGAGTDQFPGGSKLNVLAWFAEMNVHPWRAWNFRFRFDHGEFDRSSDPQERDNNTYERYAIETEWVPVPFAELRMVLRKIDHKGVNFFGEQDDEKQAYLQFHFAY